MSKLLLRFTHVPMRRLGSNYLVPFSSVKYMEQKDDCITFVLDEQLQHKIQVPRPKQCDLFELISLAHVSDKPDVIEIQLHPSS